MNIGTIVTPNAKGQIVIPQKIREELGITLQTQLQLIQAGQSLVLHPITGVIRKVDSDEAFKQILNRTRGAWAGDNWGKTRAGRRKIELAASKRRKQIW